MESVTTQPTDEGDAGPRRSCRHRVPPLQYWKNERIEYERRKSGTTCARYVKYYVNLNVNLEFFQTGWIVKDIIMNPSPQVVPRKRKNATKYVTSRAKKSTDSYTLLIILY